MKIHRLIVASIFGLFLYGDVMYEMVTTTEEMMGAGGGETKTTIFIKDDYQRTEITSINPMGEETKNILITRLDKGVMWALDTRNKKYTEIKLGVAPKVEEEKEFEEEIEEKEPEVPDIKVERTGKKKVVLNKECEEVVVSMKVDSDEGSVNFTQTMWVTDDIPGYKEINAFTKRMTEMGVASSQRIMAGDKESYEAFQKKIQDIEGFPLEFTMEMEMGTGEMSFSMKTQNIITKIDDKPISQKVFEIPEGFSLKE